MIRFTRCSKSKLLVAVEAYFQDKESLEVLVFQVKQDTVPNTVLYNMSLYLYDKHTTQVLDSAIL